MSIMSSSSSFTQLMSTTSNYRRIVHNRPVQSQSQLLSNDDQQPRQQQQTVNNDNNANTNTNDDNDEDNVTHKLIEQWIQEWLDDARRVGSKVEFTYRKALRSLREYSGTPPLLRGADCKKLKGFGDKICAQIDKKLSKHYGPQYMSQFWQQSGDGGDDPSDTLPVSTTSTGRTNRNGISSNKSSRSKPKSSSTRSAIVEFNTTTTTTTESSSAQAQITDMFAIRKRLLNTSKTNSPTVASPLRKQARKASNRTYIPAQGSTSYAILIALLRYELEYEQRLVNRLDLQQLAQHYTSTNLKSNFFGGGRGGGSHCLGGNGLASIKTLLNRQLIDRTDARNSYFFLTDTGRRMARNLSLASPSLKEFNERYVKSMIIESLDEPNGNNDGNDDDNGGDGQNHDTILNTQCSNSQSSSQSTTQSSTTSSSSSSYRPFIFAPNTYDIILLLDSRERISTNFCTENRAAFVTALQKQNIQVEIRTLPLGDFVWIARQKTCQTSSSINGTTTSEGSSSSTESTTRELESELSTQFTSINGIGGGDNNGSQSSNDGGSHVTADICKELVLDFIIERKRLDDLAMSIRDHRWSEQKQRLKHCGIRRPIYLIEQLSSTQMMMNKSNHQPPQQQQLCGLKLDALEQAITNCAMDGFDVKRTGTFEETIRYLTFLHRWLVHHYRGRTLMSVANKEILWRTVPNDYQYITFNEFAVQSGKVHTYTTQEMFVKHLLQIKGLSLKKISTIVKRWPTFATFLDAYDRRPDRYSKQHMLTDLRCCDDGQQQQQHGNSAAAITSRRFGSTLSCKIFEYYCNNPNDIDDGIGTGTGS